MLGSEAGDARSIRPRTSSASAAWRRASCSSSTSRPAGSSRTTRSRRGRHPAALRRVVRRQRRPLRRPRRQGAARRSHRARCATRQLAFGYSQEDLRVLLAPMAQGGEEPIGSMGNDNAARRPLRPAPAAVLLLQAALRPGHQPADRPDPRVDRHVAGAPASAPRATCSTRRPSTRRQLVDGPADPAQRRARDAAPASTTVASARTRSTSPGRSQDGPEGLHARAGRRLRRGLRRRRPPASTSSSCPTAASAADRAPIPSLLAVAAVHHHLVREGTRLQAGLVRRVRRAARGPPLRDADRLRRQRDQPVPAVRDRRRAASPTGRVPDVASADDGRAQRRQGDRQGPAQDDLQDGDLDDPVLLRRADLRGRRPRAGSSSTAHFTGTASRIGGIGLEHARPGGARPPRARLRPHGRRRRPAAGRRRLRVAPRRRAPHVEPGDDRAAPARRPRDERHRAGQATTSTPRMVNEDAARRATLRGLLRFRPRRRGRSRSTRSSRPRRSSSASPPARCRSARSRPRRTRRSRSR